MNVHCAFCQLPMPVGRNGADAEPIYCCSGCRFAAAVAGAGGETGANRWMLARLGFAIFLSLNVLVFTMALWASDLVPATDNPLDRVLAGLYRYLALLFALPVPYLLAGPIWANAIDGLRRRRWPIDLLLLAGVAAAFAMSLTSVFGGDGPVYFEVACAVLVFVTLGRWLEAVGKQKAGEAIAALAELLPDTVRVERDGRELTVATAEIRAGDRVRVLPGERIPCDGTLSGEPAAIDESILTGEAVPRVVEVGGAVRGGGLAVDSVVSLTVTRPPAEGTLARFIAEVRRSLGARSGYERLAERVTRWFLPSVVAIAIAAAVGHGSASGPAAGVLAGLAVLLIACPCALGIATPLATWAAIGTAANRGVLIRDGDALEVLAGVRSVRFDKTGTLTTGSVEVARFTPATGISADRAIRAAARLARSSTHPFATAILRYGGSAAEIEPTSGVKTVAGRGLIAGGVLLGSPRFLADHGIAWPAEWPPPGDDPVSVVADDGRALGLFTFREVLRKEAAGVVTDLRERGLDVAVLTGDHAGRAASIAAILGCPAAGELLPGDKVMSLQQAPRPVVFVGDGLNDAAALAAADVGVALGHGADVSRDVADVCLLGNDLGRLPGLIDLARRTRRVIRQNLFWAFIYNTLGIGLAVTGRLNPVWAAAAMILSSGFVVGNSMRLMPREGAGG